MTVFRPLLSPVAVLLVLSGAVANKAWLHDHLTALGGPMLGDGVEMAVAAAAWLAVAWLGSRLLDALATGNGRQGRPPRIPRLLSDLLRALLYGVALLAILAFVLGQPVTGLLATSGVVIAVLGFALRNMIADIFSGIALNIEHPYRIGDWIELAPGAAGQVDEINWRATRLITSEGTALIVPNGIVAGSRFTNFSSPERRFRVAIPILLDQEVPVARAKRVLLSALLCAEGVLPDPRPDVVVEALTPNGVAYQARFWLDDYAHLTAGRDAVATVLLEHLGRAGIDLARPKREFRPRRAPVPVPGALRRSLLRQLDLFAAFDDSEIAELGQAMRRRHLLAGDTAVHQGEDGESLFVIAEGVFDVQLAGEQGPVRLNRLRPGDVFGEMSLLTGQPRSASVVACTDSVVFELDKSHVDPVLRRRPELARQLAELMAQRQTRNEAARDRQGRGEPGPAAVGSQDLLARLRGFFKL
ncbi:mechanosensitive ion channel family protein [Azospirillum doebereinerae]|uniref:mechanosensitive ion channel family protein n=2 Tax=Azospirillum doebereinerae TaxID=92933 RepID=UPI001EE59A84|nr:mechanosensitive ion channel family protein [Azospirillum doebereinerae]MCG5243784.1 mechanosensitive ion channel family protein [Azospirillum doebereinerae]